MKRFHYAWVICFAGFWLFLCNIGMSSNVLTVYLPFIEATGISHSMGSAIITVRCLFSFLILVVLGPIYRKLSLRFAILLFCLAGAVPPLIFLFSKGPLGYYTGAAFAGIAYGGGTVLPVSILITNWFRSKRGFAIGLSSSGSAFFNMLFAPFISSLILKHSLRAAYMFQIAFMLASALLVFLLVRDRPEDMGLQPYITAETTGVRQERNAPPAPPLTKKMLFLLALMMLLNGGAALSFSGHLSVLTISCHYSAETAGRVISMFGLVMVPGKMFAGKLADIIGAKRCSLLLIGIFLSGCVCVMGMDGVHFWWCMAMATLLGFGASVYNVGPSLWSADLVPSYQYAETLRWLQMFYNFGGIAFTTVPGIIADHTGEYKSSYVLFAAMMIASAWLLIYVYRLAQRGDQSSLNPASRSAS